MMTQTLAIFYGAYRRLNAKKMFWIVLALSVLVVASIASVGFGADGVSIMGYHVTSELNTSQISRPMFYKHVLFQKLGIDIWLTWVACILAVISTAGIFPDFLSSGSIDLALSKPIGRTRLFLTQYLAGLLFVTIQVGLFSLASFIVIGARADSWDANVFLAVPLVVCFFSYLFAISALVGVLTRSTLAALLLTLLFWFVLSILHSGEAGVGAMAIITDQQAEQLEKKIAERKTAEREDEPTPKTAPARDKPTADQPTASAPAAPTFGPGTWDINDVGADVPTMERRLKKMRTDAESMRDIQRILLRVKTFLPKTAETVQLLQRSLIDVNEMPMGGGNDNEIGRRILAEQQSRSVAWIVGTSLGFEAVILALAAWIFRRRDF